MTIAVSTTTKAHRVRLLHASTGSTVTPAHARLDPHPPGWTVRLSADSVLVLRRPELDRPLAAVPAVAVTVASERWRQLLAIAPVEGEPPGTVVVDLSREDVDVPLHPVDMTLTVVLTTPSTGAPRRGRTVVARGTRGASPPTIALPEQAPGVYTSAPTRWTAALTPCELLVAGELLRTLSMSFTSTTTTVRLVDTT